MGNYQQLTKFNWETGEYIDGEIVFKWILKNCIAHGCEHGSELFYSI